MQRRGHASGVGLDLTIALQEAELAQTIAEEDDEDF